MAQSKLLNALESDVRFDGRKKTQYRDVTIETGVVAMAEGSARVKIGDTEVIAGVKMALETPYPDSPDQGNLMVNVELLPLSNPNFEVGPPSILAIELARVTDRGVRESGAIDTKKLCIKAGEKVWGVIVDICPINASGNLFDACSIATLAALKNAKFPKLVEEEGYMSVDYHEKTSTPLELAKLPVGITVHKIGDHLVIDPLPEEEEASEGRLTVTSIADGTIVALQKGGNELAVDQVTAMVDLAVEKAKELRSKL